MTMYSAYYPAQTSPSIPRSRFMKYALLTLKKMFRYLLKPLSFVPALCMMYLIYTFSSQPAAVSSEVSIAFGRKLIILANRVLSLELSDPQIIYYADLFHALVRKLAHVTEYFLLAVSVALPLYVYRLRGFALVLAAGLFCVGFAGLDEYHQTMVPGRSGALRDVAIDSIGIFAGIYLTRIMGYIGRKTIFAPLSLTRRQE